MRNPYPSRQPQRASGPQQPARPSRPGQSGGAGRAASPSGDYPLPRATAAVLGGLSQSDRPYVGSNASLALNKLIGPWADVLRGTFEDNQRRRERRRARFLESCAEACSSQAADEVRKAMYERRQAMLATYRTSGWEVREHTAHPAWRFVSGLGMANPLEVNLVLHRIGGFPYIPGSSIKGAVRAYAELALGADPVRPDAPAEKVPEPIRRVFGAQSQQGGVVFFDALPVNTPKVELDVINVHYPDYYQKGEPPTDWQNPNPILFLAVGKETRFAFAVASRSPELADQAMDWLRGALQTTGLGGKTAAGYGSFAPLPGARPTPAAGASGGR